MTREKVLTLPWRERQRGKREERTTGGWVCGGKEEKRGKKRIARRRYIMSGISRKIVSGARTAKMSVRGEGENAGDVRRWPNKYLTKSSGKLIPSLGRLLRGAYLQPQPHRRANDAPEWVRAVLLRDFLRAILRLDWCRVQGITARRETVRDERWKYWNVIGTRDSLSVIRSSRGINASCRISIDVAYVMSYLNGETRDPETDVIRSSRILF